MVHQYGGSLVFNFSETSRENTVYNQQSCQSLGMRRDIKAKLNGCRVFSKMEFKSVFWQTELEPTSRYLTVFYANGKLYRYERLTMGIKPAQGELNVALRPVFAHIPNAHQIHDDLIVATQTLEEHVQVIEECMKAIAEAGLTLKPAKCFFAW